MNLSQYMLNKRYGYENFSQTQITLNYIILTLITLLAYFAVSRNSNLFVHERLTNLHKFENIKHEMKNMHSLCKTPDILIVVKYVYV